MIDLQRIPELFVDVADTLVDEFDLLDFLHRLTEHAATVSGARAVGLMMLDQDDVLRYMGSTSDSARMLELLQLQSAEGPCLDCSRSGRAVVNADLTEATERWPVFAPAALAAGFRSVHAFPMRLRDRTIGALNLFGGEDGTFEPGEVGLVQALADVATIAVLQERQLSRADAVTEQLQAALNSRVVLEQAKGVLAQRAGLDMEQAFATLRRYARDHNLRLGELAHSVAHRSVPAQLVVDHTHDRRRQSRHSAHPS